MRSGSISDRSSGVLPERARCSESSVRKVYLQRAIDCHSRYAWGRLYPNKLPVTAVHVMNNHVLPTFDAHQTRISTVLTDNGREFCGRPDRHPYELFLWLEDIEHRTTQVRRPQSNGFVERLHRTLLDDHFRVLGRTKFYESIQEMQTDRDAYLVTYDTKRAHQGRGMNGRTPAEVFARCLPKTKKPKRTKRETLPRILSTRSGRCQVNTLSVQFSFDMEPGSKLSERNLSIR